MQDDLLMVESSGCSNLAQAIFSGGLAFSGVATGGIALALSAYINMRKLALPRISLALKVALVVLTIGLVSSTAAAGLAFATLQGSSTLGLASVAMWLTLGAALTASIVIAVAVFMIP